MAWGSEFPVTGSATDVQAWSMIDQITKATTERHNGAGRCVWPQSSNSWDTGTITAATETTLSTGHTWCGGTDDTSGVTFTRPFSCGNPTQEYEAPFLWRVVVDDNDRTKVVEVPINSWTNTGVLTVNNMRDFVTSGQIPSIASLVGKTFTIIRGDYGIWWHNRLMEWPNDYQWTEGTVSSLPTSTDPITLVVTPASPSHTFIRDETKRWIASEHVGRDLLVYGDDGFLKRVAITANTANTLTFATVTWTTSIGSAYVVIHSGGRAIPGRLPTYPFTFYRGIMDSCATHDPTDVLTYAYLPAGTIKTPGAGGGPGVCERPPDIAWDMDVWTEVVISPDDQLCGRPADKCYSPNLYKTIRGMQIGIEAAANDYVEAKSYASGTSVPNLNPAEMFRLAGINAFTGTTGAVAGSVGNDGSANNQIAISGITLPYYPIQVWYSFKDNVAAATGGGSSTSGYIGDFYKWGRGYMLNNTTLVDETNNFVFHQDYDDGTNPIVRGDNSRPVTISPGWTRIVPREFKRMFANDGVFIPDLETDSLTGLQNPVDPAAPIQFDGTTNDCYGVGSFQKMGNSTRYIDRKHENQSWYEPQGYDWEAGDNFTTGDLARYVGDNALGPSIGGTIPDGTGQFFKDAVHSVAKYEDHFYVGNLSESHQATVNLQKSGEATEDGTTTWLRDSNQNWFDHVSFGGVMRVETGTATSGSTTTSLFDSTKDDSNETSPTNPLHCYWLLSRFPGRTGPYVGFTVEIDYTDGLGNTTTYQRLITSGSHTTCGVSWTEPLPRSANGLVYRIREPYAINRWKGRTLQITRVSPTTGLPEVATTTISGNSSDTLYFPAISWAITKGSIYQIVEPQIGGVYKWDGTKWVLPSGSDAVRTMIPTPANFHLSPLENANDRKVRFGRYMVGDCWQANELWNEMYRALNVLKHSKSLVIFAEDAVDGTTENNGQSYSAGDSGTYDSSCVDIGGGAKTTAEGMWGTNVIPSGPGFPKAESHGTFAKFTSGCAPDDGCHTYSIDRLYSYGVVDNICTRQACAVDYYNFAGGPYGMDATAGCTSGVDVTFSANGDSVAYHLFTLFASESAAIRKTARKKLGSSGLPTGSYPNGTTCQNKNTGYAVTDAVAVIKWDVAGGFNYVA